MRIATLDLAILAAYLLAMVAFGLWMGRRQTGAADFMLGERRIPWWLVLFSIVATETSTVTFLSIPGHAYRHDLAWLQLPLGFAIGRVVVTLLLLPRYFKGELFTAYELLRDRFGGATRQIASLLFIVTRTLADGLRLFLSAIVLQEVAGLQVEHAVIGLGAATVVYTFVGGMRAVIWTDFVQFVVYMAGAAIAAWILLGRIDGGLDGFLDAARAFPTPAGPVDKLRILDTSFDLGNAFNLWAGLIGGAVLAVATHGVDQLMVQRYLAAKSRAHASVALVASGIVVILQFAFFLLIGVGLAVFYAQQDPVPVFAKDDRVFTTFIVNELPRGVLGIVLGAVFSAAMSTLSGSLNSSATALSNDIWHPLFRPHAGDRERLVTARLFVVLFGALQVLVGIRGRHLDESIVNAVLAIASFTTGIVLGVFLLGIFVRRCGQTAALIGLVAGTAIVSEVRFDLLARVGPDWALAAFAPGLDGLAWPWYALLGSSATLACGTLAALLFPGPRPSSRS
ncbi:MAG: sodium/solute symporter [Planctomycetes bacterium]|nr:sodium/solute symporter [Planctomycetota bacterium]